MPARRKPMTAREAMARAMRSETLPDYLWDTALADRETYRLRAAGTIQRLRRLGFRIVRTAKRVKR